MSEKYSTDIEQVKVSVMDCVVDWEHQTQINPTTGDVYDFDGNRIEPSKAEPKKHK